MDAKRMDAIDKNFNIIVVIILLIAMGAILGIWLEKQSAKDGLMDDSILPEGYGADALFLWEQQAACYRACHQARDLFVNGTAQEICVNRCGQYYGWQGDKK